MSRSYRTVGGAALAAIVGLAAPAVGQPPAPPPPKPVVAEPTDVEAIKNELVAAAKAGDMARVRALADRLAAVPAGPQLATLSDSIDRVMPEVRANGFAIVSRKYGPWYGYGWGWPATGYQYSPTLWVAGPDLPGWRRTLESLKRARVQLADKPEALAAVDRQIADYERRITRGVWADPYHYPYHPRAVAQVGPIPPIPSSVKVWPDGPYPADRVIDRGRLGIQPERIPSVVLAHLDLPRGQGVMVAQVMPGSPAATVGLMTNDILLGIGGTVIPDDPDAVGGVVQGLKGGEPLDVSILRKGKPMTLKGLTLPAPAGAKATTDGK
jgi:hypothetical protein